MKSDEELKQAFGVFIDENDPITGKMTLGNSSDLPVSIGSLPIGSFTIGNEFDPNTTFATLKQNDKFRIECNYVTGYNISVRFTNNVTGEQFKIDGLTVHFDPADSPYDQ